MIILSIPLFKTFYDEKMGELAKEVLSSGAIAYGQYVRLFSESIANKLGHQYFLTTDNMTNAMELALKLSGVMPGDEVLTTPFSCMASNSPIATLGAIPVWTDIIPGTVEINLDKFESKINKKTKAIILYHLAGYLNNAVEVSKICKKHGIRLIEDCNNAMFSTVAGRTAGTIGDFSVYSFYPNRLINAGDGGGLAIKNKIDFEQAEKFIKYGINQSEFRNEFGEINPACDIPAIWRNIGMNNLSSALGYAQLDMLDEKIDKIHQNAKHLHYHLREFNEVYIVPSGKDSSPVNWAVLIQINKRNEILRRLKEKGINVSTLHQLNSVYSGFKSRTTDINNVQIFQDTVLALPCGWWLTDDDINTIISALRSTIVELKPGRYSYA